jgi:c-di-GMP-binding flagellar brake protein YcgR
MSSGVNRPAGGAGPSGARGGEGGPRGPAPVARERRRSGSDRRETSRISATFGVQEAVQDGDDAGHVHLCQAEDIALGGITIRHARGLEHQPRTEVALRFALPGTGEEIEARGEIVSDLKAGRFRRTGVRFIAVRPEHQKLIAAFCRRA